MMQGLLEVKVLTLPFAFALLFWLAVYPSSGEAVKIDRQEVLGRS